MFFMIEFSYFFLQYKFGQVRRVVIGYKVIFYLVIYDGRIIRYFDFEIFVYDIVVLEIKIGKIIDFIKFEVGNFVMVVGGRNMGRVGVVIYRERYVGMWKYY